MGDRGGERRALFLYLSCEHRYLRLVLRSLEVSGRVRLERERERPGVPLIFKQLGLGGGDVEDVGVRRRGLVAAERGRGVDGQHTCLGGGRGKRDGET